MKYVTSSLHLVNNCTQLTYFCKKHICSMTAAAVKCSSSRYCALIFVTLMPRTGDINGHSPQLTSCSSVPSPFDPNLTHRTTLAQCTGAGRVQARSHGVQLSPRPSTPVPRRPLTSLSPVSPPDIFALPAKVFSSCLAIISAVMVGVLFL